MLLCIHLSCSNLKNKHLESSERQTHALILYLCKFLCARFLHATSSHSVMNRNSINFPCQLNFLAEFVNLALPSRDVPHGKKKKGLAYLPTRPHQNPRCHCDQRHHRSQCHLSTNTRVHNALLPLHPVSGSLLFKANLIFLSELDESAQF